MRCSICKANQATLTCSGCNSPVCNTCSRLELYGEGCGTVLPYVFCPHCYNNPQVNPYAPHLTS